jgi:uncharacterized membrane protein
MARKKAVKKYRVVPAKASRNNSKLFAFIATFLSIIGFIIALLARKDDKYVMYYAKQSLVVFIAMVAASVISWAVIGFTLGMYIRSLLNLLVTIAWIISWIYALSGKEKEVPLIGKYAESIDL